MDNRDVSLLTKGLARRLSRREALMRGLRGVAVVSAGVAGGTILTAEQAKAVTCTCGPPNNKYCSGCPSNGCPSGYDVCYSNQGCSQCIYASGSWVSCTGLGDCGYGYKRCYDCRKHATTGCTSTCGCLTGILCGFCCSPAEVKAFMARDEQLALAGGPR